MISDAEFNTTLIVKLINTRSVWVNLLLVIIYFKYSQAVLLKKVVSYTVGYKQFLFIYLFKC